MGSITSIRTPRQKEEIIELLENILNKSDYLTETIARVREQNR